MATATRKPEARKPWTADEFCRLPEGWRYEIDEGELVIMSPGGVRHGDVTGSTSGVLWQFARNRRLGKVLTNELGVYLRHDPETLRAVDVAVTVQACDFRHPPIDAPG